MTTKAKNKVAAAKAKLEQAQKELVLAEIEGQSIEVAKSFKKTSHLVWEICQLTDWSEESRALYAKAQAMEDEVAVTLLGADERVKKLNQLDPERWNLEGDHPTPPRYFPTDKDAAYAIATSIFDRTGCRGSKAAYAEFSDRFKRVFDAYKKKAVEIFGEVGELGFEFWEQGKHDT